MEWYLIWKVLQHCPNIPYHNIPFNYCRFSAFQIDESLLGECITVHALNSVPMLQTYMHNVSKHFILHSSH